MANTLDGKAAANLLNSSDLSLGLDFKSGKIKNTAEAGISKELFTEFTTHTDNLALLRELTGGKFLPAAETKTGAGYAGLAGRLIPPNYRIVASGLTPEDVEKLKHYQKPLEETLHGDFETARKDLAAIKEADAAKAREAAAAAAAAKADPKLNALANQIKSPVLPYAPEGNAVVAHLNPDQIAKLNTVLADKDLSMEKVFGSARVLFDKAKGTITVPGDLSSDEIGNVVKFNNRARVAVSTGDPGTVKLIPTAQVQTPAQNFAEVNPSELQTPSSTIVAQGPKVKQGGIV